jgi:tRNA1Val (adenine37-N6)-methyltransferase
MFHFKQFSIEDNRCAMKVGTDAVLLGAWVNIPTAKRILDVGTGSGIIAFMLAQRTKENVNIEGVEIAAEDAKQAQENLEQTRWCNRVLIHHSSLQNFNSPFRYDLIVSNPPFFRNSQLPPAATRANARHTQSLTYQALLDHSIKFLKKSGRLAVVLPYEEGNQFLLLANNHKLFCIRQLAFYSRHGKPQERWLFEFSFEDKEALKEKLILHGEGDSWSDEYKNLTRDFYLKS